MLPSKHFSEVGLTVGVNLSQDWPAIDPTAFTRAVIEQGVTGTAMPGWSRFLGEDEARWVAARLVDGFPQELAKGKGVR